MRIFGGAKKLKKTSFTDNELLKYLCVTTAPGLISFHFLDTVFVNFYFSLTSSPDLNFVDLYRKRAPRTL